MTKAIARASRIAGVGYHGSSESQAIYRVYTRVYIHDFKNKNDPSPDKFGAIQKRTASTHDKVSRTVDRASPPETVNGREAVQKAITLKPDMVLLVPVPD